MTVSEDRDGATDLGVLRGLADGQYGVVARWQLIGHGLSAYRIDSWVRSGRLVGVRPGVYAVGHLAVPRRGIWMAAVLAGGPGAILSHDSAAALWEFGVPGSVIHVIGRSARLRETDRVSGSFPLRIHRTNFIHEEDRSVRHGIPVSSVARTFSDIAGSETEERLKVKFNDATRAGFTDIAAMRRILLRRRASEAERSSSEWSTAGIPSIA